ncbi:hypothetical protein [Ornithinimicrobium kibberense]|uniref:hypothetical protein n=1 Tax=Ornithinimicrobium kibberense TaxID=282060 RepID=UPI00362276B5
MGPPPPRPAGPAGVGRRPRSHGAVPAGSPLPSASTGHRIHRRPSRSTGQGCTGRTVAGRSSQASRSVTSRRCSSMTWVGGSSSSRPCSWARSTSAGRTQAACSASELSPSACCPRGIRAAKNRVS